MADKNKISNKKTEEYPEQLNNYFVSGLGTNIEKLSNFPKYVPRQDLTRFLAKYELYKKILNVEGAIVEGGVRFGGGLMTFAQLSAIFEPVNYTRKIIGFDTFSGFPNLTKEDTGSTSKFAHKGGLAIDSFKDLEKSVSLYDSNRFLGEIPKVQLIKGDVTLTIQNI